MDRTALRNFKQPLFLSFVEVAAQFDLAIDAIQDSYLGIAFAAILGINAVVLKPDSDALQVDAFPLRIEP